MTLEQLPAIIPIAVFIGGCLATAWRVGYLIASYGAKIDKQLADHRAEFNALLELKEAENGKAIGRVYERFDEYKNFLENNFVRRDMCQILHNGNSVILANMEKKLDSQSEKLDALFLKVAGMK